MRHCEVRSNLYTLQSGFEYRRALNCRLGCYFVLIQSNQRSSHQKCFFSHSAFTLQIGQNHGLLNLTSNRSLMSHASARFANAPTAAHPTMFCPFSPEAYLLTGKEKRPSPCIYRAPELKTSDLELKTHNPTATTSGSGLTTLFGLLASPQLDKQQSTGFRLRPKTVRRYSTFGGTSG
ncbi:hypothetical protein SAMN05428975_5559 [Mucilaginibacter sp. OK268]|nr:hypothetical protein SAMN05428975_5559 [Mucilaginibacter sp. OK268]